MFEKSYQPAYLFIRQVLFSGKLPLEELTPEKCEIQISSEPYILQ
jgi:hypothetical protein